jgi:hypothetical protein
MYVRGDDECLAVVDDLFHTRERRSHRLYLSALGPKWRLIPKSKLTSNTRSKGASLRPGEGENPNSGKRPNAKRARKRPRRRIIYDTPHKEAQAGNAADGCLSASSG